MQASAIIIIILIGLLSIYVFYLIGIYIKLENRRSLILGKFSEVDKQIESKLEETKLLLEIIENKEISETRLSLVNSITVNDKIKFNKILDSLIDDIDTNSKKAKDIITGINEINQKIDYAKEFYNDSLYEYNIILSGFNGKIMKKICKFTEYNTF